MRHVLHLARRFAGSLSRRPPPEADRAWAVSHLLPAEAELWKRLSAADQRHSILVTRRFVDLLGTEPERAAMAGALLHDIGKLDADLGTVGRVIATLVGPRTSRFRRYHDHEAIGARWLIDAGSEKLTVDLVRRTASDSFADAMRAADEI